MLQPLKQGKEYPELPRVFAKAFLIQRQSAQHHWRRVYSHLVWMQVQYWQEEGENNGMDLVG